MGIKLTGQWELAARLCKEAPERFEAALQAGLEAEAQFMRGKIVAKLGKTGDFQPLAGSTLASRKASSRGGGGRFVKGGGSKPLNRSGNLKGSIAVVQAGRDRFVGVPAAAKGRGGSLVRIAAVHEFGQTIVQRMTDKQRRYLHAVLPTLIGPRTASGSFFSHGGTGIIVIHVPARPFIRPVFEQHGPKSAERFLRFFAAALGGMYGTPGGGSSMGTSSGKPPPDRSAAAIKGWATRRARA